jgi:hypothetical protein
LDYLRDNRRSCASYPMAVFRQ